MTLGLPHLVVQHTAKLKTTAMKVIPHVTHVSQGTDTVLCIKLTGTEMCKSVVLYHKIAKAAVTGQRYYNSPTVNNPSSQVRGRVIDCDSDESK